MRRVELARAASLFSPGLDELPVLRVLNDPGVRIPTVSVSDEDVAIRRSDDIGRLIESVRAVAGDTHLAECQQDFSFRTEFDDDLSLPGRGFSSGAQWNCVSHPDVSLPVYMDAVRKYEHPFAEALHELPRRVEFEHDRQF